MPTIDRLFKKMIELDASDLHMSTGSKPVVRIHGSIRTLEDEDELTPAAINAIIEEVTPAINLREYREDWDTDFAYQMGSEGRFRANLFVDSRGPAAVFRTIPSRIRSADELELSDAVKALCTLPKGLVLVTGPTGCGKSTTLAALINEINETRQDHIITIEDPIEFIHPNKRCLINQREVRIHTKGFKQALRAALREDPDVVLIGELRDLETMEIAIETAETGHLVFGTLHTTTAASTVDRIIDQFPTDHQEQIRVMLSTSLRAVISQTLLKRADGRARVAAFEILMVNSAVASLIREGKTYQIPSVIQTGAKLGMIIQNDALKKLVQRRLITYEEALSKSVDREGLERALPEEALKHKARLGHDKMWNADLGISLRSTPGGDEGGPRLGAEGLERRTLRTPAEGEDSAAAKAISKAKEVMAAKAAAPTPAPSGDAGKLDDFAAFRKKLAGKRV